MNPLKEILKLIASLNKKGFATKEEKIDLASKVAKLKEADQEAIGEQVADVNALSENGEEGGEGAGADEDAEVEKNIKALFSKHASEIKEELTNELKAYLKQEKDLAAKKVGVYNPEVQENRKALSDRLREMAKALYAGNDAKMKEMTTDATGSPYAGYIVDSELSAEIRHLMTQYGVARREMMALPLSKGSYKANNLATDITVFWVDQAAVISSSEVVLGQETLTLEKLGVIVTLTSELLEDGEIDMISFIGNRVAEGFAKAEDLAFFLGDGSATYGGFTGLLNNTSVNEIVMDGTTFASMDYDDLVDMQDATPSGALANAKYYMHRTIRSIIRKLKDDNGQYIYSPANSSGPASIDGYPLVLVEAMPANTVAGGRAAGDTSFVLFGDLKQACIFGYKSSGMTIDKFNAGTVRNVANNADINLITTQREAIRFTERVGYIVIIPTAVTKLTTASVSS